MNLKKIRINGERLGDSLRQMARMGGTSAGGVHRLALSDEDRRARDLLSRWLRELDLDVGFDEMGNLFGRKTGADERLPPVLMGSHMDSQPHVEVENTDWQDCEAGANVLCQCVLQSAMG